MDWMRQGYHALEKLIQLHIDDENYDCLRSWQLAAWCQERGADEWTISAIGSGDVSLFQHFDEATEGFRSVEAERERLISFGGDMPFTPYVRHTTLWRLHLGSLAVLQEFLPEGLFTYRAGEAAWFEDPVFYRNGELMLGVLSHEGEGIVRVTADERLLLEADGFKLRLPTTRAP